MAKWSALRQNWTPVAVADTTNFTDNGYFALQGGVAGQRLVVTEVLIGGLAVSAAASQLVLSRDSTVGATSLSGGTLAAQDPATANLVNMPVQFSVSTTKPQRSSTLQLLALPLQGYGGIIKWTQDLPNGIGMLGATASFGELSISHLNQGTPALVSSHFIFEPI